MSLEFYCLQEWIGEQVMPILSGMLHHRWQMNILLFVIVSAASYVLHVLIEAFFRAIQNISKVRAH